MINEILAKLPEHTVSRLEWYINAVTGYDIRRCYDWAIFSTCESLLEFGVVTLNESKTLYKYYLDRLNGGDAR